MGFFGFLKKKEGLQAPSNPAETKPLPPPEQAPVPAADAPPDLLDEFPAPPGEKGPMPEAAAAPPMPGLLDDAPPPPPGLDDNDVFFPPVTPSATPPADDMAPVTPIGPAMPPPEAPPEAGSGHASLPDFSEEELMAAQHLDEAPPAQAKKRQQPETLPSFKDVEQFRPVSEGALYVPATRYREALSQITKCKSAARKGQQGLRQMATATATHKEPFSQFAERLNAIQEELIRMDNTLIAQR